MTKSQYSIPIGLFTFNRLDTTKEVFDKIREIKPERLYLISDGARDNRNNEDEKVKEVRNYIESHIDWECEVKKNYAEKNMGCKKRMASGITWIFEQEEKAIILEDDIKPSKFFFDFMRDMLEKYKDDPNIMLVSGFKYNNDFPIEYACSFSKFPMIWGWGTWRRAWEKYDITMKSWPEKKKKGALKSNYNFWGYKVISRHFDQVYYSVDDTWDYQWTYAVLENKGLSVVPKYNLIENLGCNRNDATHTTGASSYDFSIREIEQPYNYPSVVEANKEYDIMYLNREWGFSSMVRKVINRITRNK